MVWWWSILLYGSYRFSIPTWVQCQAQLIYGDYRSEYTSLFAPQEGEQNTKKQIKDIETRQAFLPLIQLFGNCWPILTQPKVVHSDISKANQLRCAKMKTFVVIFIPRPS